MEIEIRDLDALTTKEEVEAAIEATTGTAAVGVGLTKPNSRGQIMAFVQMSEASGQSLLKAGRIKIGWISARVKERLVVKRCFRCLGYGHTQALCEGPKRFIEGICFKCGAKGHKHKECTNQANCFLCTENREHLPGSGMCSEFRKALEEAKCKAKKRLGSCKRTCIEVR